MHMSISFVLFFKLKYDNFYVCITIDSHVVAYQFLNKSSCIVEFYSPFKVPFRSRRSFQNRLAHYTAYQLLLTKNPYT